MGEQHECHDLNCFHTTPHSCHVSGCKRDDLQQLRDENTRLRERVKSLEGRMRILSKYMGNGRTQLAHDLVKDTVMAIEMSALDGGKGVQDAKKG